MNTTEAQSAQLGAAAPFWISLALIPVAIIAAIWGGWWFLLVPVSAWYAFAGADFAVGRNQSNADPETPEDDLYWHRAITIAWAPLQFLFLFGMLAYVAPSETLSAGEKIGIFFGVGVITGVIGINYSHELMHQKSRLQRRMADFLLAMVLYSHFRSEHLLVHHRYVGTPRDPVTARYNENFYRYFPRVLKACLFSAFRAEAEMLQRKDKPWSDLSNPFWTYWAMQGAMILLAFVIGGWAGVGLFLLQAIVAIWQLELVNYVEHYGLTRKHKGDGVYEHVQPRHSWNADQKVSNWLLINLQRHSDHHYKPNRPFPLLQTYPSHTAPLLPYGYPVMTVIAMIPSVWRRIMNRRVRHWREVYYPEIQDWAAYNKATNPLPK
jgi:alkane 1-monooxygenase